MLPRAPAPAAAAAAATNARRRLVQLAGHYSSTSAAGAPPPQQPEVLAAVSPEGGVGTITLNRPRALNALNLPMVRALDGVLREWAGDPKVKLVVMKGAGGQKKAFCAGGDVVGVRQAVLDGGVPAMGTPGHAAADFFREEYRLNYAIFTAKKPQVSLWDGFVMGGGVGLSIGSRFRVATERTVFAMPETAIGLFPDVGGTHWLPRLPGGLGHYLGLTGARLNAADLLYAGMATHVVPSDKIPALEAALEALGRTLSSSPGCGGKRAAMNDEVDAVLRSFASSVGESAALCKVLDACALEAHRGEIDAAFVPPGGGGVEGSEEGVEGIVRRLEGMERGGSEWAGKTLKLLRKASPTALQVTLRALREGAHLPLEETFAMEYRLSQACMHPGSDFLEGVRALLVDKDNAPRWNPPTLAGATPEVVARFFQPRADLGAHELTL